MSVTYLNTTDTLKLLHLGQPKAAQLAGLLRGAGVRTKPGRGPRSTLWCRKDVLAQREAVLEHFRSKSPKPHQVGQPKKQPRRNGTQSSRRARSKPVLARAQSDWQRTLKRTAIEEGDYDVLEQRTLAHLSDLRAQREATLTRQLDRIERNLQKLCKVWEIVYEL